MVSNIIAYHQPSAQNWIRTSTSLRTLRPEHSASTNFAIWASHKRTAKVKYYFKLPNKKAAASSDEGLLFVCSRLYLNFAQIVKRK